MSQVDLSDQLLIDPPGRRLDLLAVLDKQTKHETSHPEAERIGNEIRENMQAYYSAWERTQARETSDGKQR